MHSLKQAKIAPEWMLHFVQIALEQRQEYVLYNIYGYDAMKCYSIFLQNKASDQKFKIKQIKSTHNKTHQEQIKAGKQINHSCH